MAHFEVNAMVDGCHKKHIIQQDNRDAAKARMVAAYPDAKSITAVELEGREKRGLQWVTVYK